MLRLLWNDGTVKFGFRTSLNTDNRKQRTQQLTVTTVNRLVLYSNNDMWQWFDKVTKKAKKREKMTVAKLSTYSMFCGRRTREISEGMAILTDSAIAADNHECPETLWCKCANRCQLLGKAHNLIWCRQSEQCMQCGNQRIEYGQETVQRWLKERPTAIGWSLCRERTQNFDKKNRTYGITPMRKMQACNRVAAGTGKIPRNRGSPIFG